ncbi:putative neutral sphingomyelinase [Hyalella azteca]|uniref:sphingomyelin phosphodiesterase n=1 Tax=Hyalella azteca TaxID=294128 RepID=A0A8B7NA94_HYAAZ|nr:putative neutral sphingomyelinase [Hyalella azteca]
MMVEEPAEDAAVLQETTVTEDKEIMIIRVLTLNIWGIPFVSKDREARISAICQQICSASEPFNFLFLQEVWSSQDYTTIAAKLKEVLPHSHFFYSGVVGAGLCIFSKSPLTSIHFHPWSVNGLPHKVYHGDWWGGKGVGFCRTQVNGINFILATTHLHAVYHHLQDEYLHHRVVQAYETSQVLDWCSSADSVVILGGDLNCEPHEVPYRLLRDNAQLRDAFFDAPNKPVDGIGATNETPGNILSYICIYYSLLTWVKAHIGIMGNERADAVAKLGHHLDHSALFPLPCSDALAGLRFSDHEAVRAVFSLTRKHDTDLDDETLSSNGPSPHRFLAPATECNGGLTDKHKNAANNNSGAQLKSQLNAMSKLTLTLHQQTDTLLDAAAICAQGKRSMDSSWNFYAFLSLALTLVNLILIGLICPQGTVQTGTSFFLMMVLLATVLVTFYSVWMVVVWNKMERNAVLATQLGLECLLEDMRKKNAIQFQKISVPDLRRSGNDK